MSLTDEQLALRRTGITATDIVALLRLSSYGNPCSVYREKVEGWRRPESPFMERGRYLEPAARDWYASKHKATLTYPGTIRHPTRPLLLATPDAVVDGKRVLEVKTVGSVALGQWGPPNTDQCPPKVIAQVTYQMGVLGLPEAHVAALMVGEHLNVYAVAFNADLFEMLAGEAERWWKAHVEPKTPPKGYRALKEKAVAA